jgi:kynurenine formamidase
MSGRPDRVPAYAQLPVDPSKPPHAAWGVFGDDDQVGTLNLIGADEVRDAARLVRRGAVFSLNWALELPDPPILGRKAMRHTTIALHPGTDDYYDRFYPQMSSQWDALCHMPHPVHGGYNDPGLAPGRNGIEHWARRGIAGRFVLADVARHREREGRPIRFDQSDAITVADLEPTLGAAGATLRTGDILLVRTGWMAGYEAADAATRRALSEAGQELRTPGLEGSEEMAAWLWDQHIAAVASDCPALEVLPSGPWASDDPESTYDSYLHFYVIALLGLAVGEMFDLEALARDCADDDVYEGLLTAAPLNKTGGAGSTANAIALK